MRHAGKSFADRLWLGVRSLVWTILLPGMVAGYVPWRFFELSQPGFDVTNLVDALALLLIAAGVVLLGTCMMYLSVTTILIGEALLVRSGQFLAYFLFWLAA